MIINSIQRLIFISLSLYLCTCIWSCGGGGSDSSDSRNVSGEWQGVLSKISDNCGGGDANDTVSHSVSQNHEDIVLVAANGQRYIGNIIGEDRFSVSNSHDLSEACSDTIQIDYKDINSDDDSTASAEISAIRSCSGREDCQIKYTGTVTRSAIPSATPDDTTVATSGACSDMAVNTASGVYSGDGGCGISSTKFSFSSAARDTVILEPFGANGATSFPLLSAGDAGGNSNRKDLTIHGVGGYACSITCSPPLTFTTTCFKEGQATCSEKF